MRILVAFFCIFLLAACTHVTREAWSWDEKEKTFVVRNAPLRKEQGDFEIGQKTTKTLRSDLDHDGVEEVFQFADERIMVTEGDKEIWGSPEDWKVTDVILADSTRDGIIDINIAAWRDENFGPSKPFWEENSLVPHHHFFVMQMRDDTIVPLWQSSNLESINQEIQIADVDGDGKNELVVIERDYSETGDCHNTALAVWRWNEWGFYNVWRSERGDYCGLEVEDGNIVVLR